MSTDCKYVSFGIAGFWQASEFFEMQAVLDGNTIITYQTINANAYNVEDIMSIPTSLTRNVVAEEAELAIAA